MKMKRQDTVTVGVMVLVPTPQLRRKETHDTCEVR
jgi:hypothetical protein